MIGVIFQFGDEAIEVRIIDTQVLFRTTTFGMQFTDISGLKLSKEGVIKEFPDLKDDQDWDKKAKTRFKEKIKSLKDENERIKYIIEDLQKYGYKATYLQKAGFRRIKL